MRRRTRVHEGRVVDLVETGGDVGLEHPHVARAGMVDDVLDRVLRSPAGPEAVAGRAEPGLEDRFEHQFQAGLHHAVPRGRDAQATHLPAGFRDHALGHRQWDERPCLQVDTDLVEEPEHSTLGRLDARSGPAVDPGRPRSPVRPDPAPCFQQERRICHKVEQIVEHAAGVGRCPIVQLGLNPQYPRGRRIRGRLRNAGVPRRISCHFLSSST
jgi:hypothetical protein